ncbi:Tol-Pal system beta propeller repeat protein TolB [Alisedimentitalea sp. MJ-SS2]|uniref:Tol-Pal system beta propeller repeat protein TolB n=1 Tax=Aliisedimentitalea sp. MJ-SS2 TaxID=3049795 RepID=UPI00290737C5|nr:Tol-Pal system beta propeller repeat protein TolB [Alisedimentitalea sp. MJ-SS2]MDU8925841.1 Tol-Pal system beta propeller repeat protein TolB [Alisedimentitalea sp. MJ-SS2]
MIIRWVCAGLALFAVWCVPPYAEAEPLRIEITEGVQEPMPYAVPDFVAENGAAAQVAQDIARVIADDLGGTGLFREIGKAAYISQITSFSSPVQFADWKAINARALITGAVSVNGNNVTVKFRVWDVFADEELGNGLQFSGTIDGWRRMGHKVADAVYSRITGEGGYFDSRVVFVSETGPKNDRKKRLAIMDYDGANVQYLTDSRSIVLNPRFSPTGDRVLYTSFETGFPRIYLLDVASVGRRVLQSREGTMSFGSRFSPSGDKVVFSLEAGGNTDLYEIGVSGGGERRLTSAPSIETSPSFSPDGSRIVFESDRSGSRQLYVMPASGGEAQRISFGPGNYGTPVWSPRGDLIAFTKQHKGRFHIGVMRVDGQGERLLTASFLEEGPTWSPNGRVIMFTRETQGAQGSASLYMVDITGRSLKKVRTPGGASDPSWSPLQK